jgi:Ca2+-binding RTX toxin-like protein
MDGGEGSDIYSVDTTDTVHDGGSGGTDKVITAVSFTLSAASGIEQLTAKAGTTANITLTGDEGANKIIGNVGNNTLKGMDGADTLTGGDGDDKLTGGLGRDTMTGGNGIDAFIFKVGDSPASLFDTVNDFVTGVDKIDLPTVGAAGLVASGFAVTSAASNAFSDALNAATAAMAGGNKSAVFVAAPSNGWLFWNTDSNPHTADEAVRLNGLNSTSSFHLGDLT